MRNFRNIILVFIVVVLALLMFLDQPDNHMDRKPQKPVVALSTFSLYDITKHISEDTLEIVMILPFGVDAHSFEPTPKLMAKIDKSDLVVYSGAGLEPWIEGFEFKNKVIDMSQHVKLRVLSSDEHHSDHDEHTTHSNTDPHYWLDIDNMRQATKLIEAELIKISPANKELYVKNTQIYLAMLHSLDEDYKKSLSSCQGDTIVVNHNAFSYLSSRYGFHVEALSGFSPEAEPSAKNMARLIELVKEHGITTIFFESFVNDRPIKSIAQEAKVNVEVLQALGNITADEAKEHLTFEDIMRKNLEKISKALDCK